MAPDFSRLTSPFSSPTSRTTNTSPTQTLNQSQQPSIFSNQETIQSRLKTLIEGSNEPWTYGIFWQSSVDISGTSLLGWGDGYYNGEEREDNFNMNPTLASSAEQEHRRNVLRDLHSLISGVPVTAEDDPVNEEVTDTEWFFLVSMTQSFINGGGLPGQAFLNSLPIWVAGEERLLGSSCERVRQAQMFGLKTMVCIPLGNGVIELGSTEYIFRNEGLMNQVRVLFN